MTWLKKQNDKKGQNRFDGFVLFLSNFKHDLDKYRQKN
ncbi:hypothetical protein CHCC14821_1803 [Bacillus paralicheniformis]|nr:hypothetical protein CHCC14821_1803 [Bacillus paralicheniformis]